MKKKVTALLLGGLLVSSAVGILLVTGLAMAEKPDSAGKPQMSFSITITGDIIASATLKGSDGIWEPLGRLSPRLKTWTANGEAAIDKFGPFGLDPEDSLACAAGSMVEPERAALTVEHAVSSSRDIWLTTYVWSDSEGEHTLYTLDRIREGCEQCAGSWSGETDTWTVNCNDAEVWYTVRSGETVTKCKLLVSYGMTITRQS